MTEFNPGDGWRRLAEGERDQDEMIVYYGDEGSTSWVRVPPVPSLPTEPYTVIRAWTDAAIQLECILRPNGQWWDIRGVAERDVQRAARFEVLAMPADEPVVLERVYNERLEQVRRETAKAVLEEARAYVFQALAEDVNFDHIARYFVMPSTTPPS